MKEAIQLASYINGSKSSAAFYEEFAGQYSDGFNPDQDLQKIGVVNQTTMLASETQAISDYLKEVIVKHHELSAENSQQRFANTRDTLCYATNDNQDATHALLDVKADLALVVERENKRYFGSTVLPLDWAYKNARLIARPDREWLEP